ncbi:sugar dehydrogenase complex small subunit [Neokomagataea thailandica]|uniref:sugar dehydrogenase complex small subunit n=1 Tax=Neokomagataea TaxID=1223423 RepID=UPI0012EE69B0|nr:MULTISPECIES: sugar dehydrogenase complex small subunit [Neokomagataea]
MVDKVNSSSIDKPLLPRRHMLHIMGAAITATFLSDSFVVHASESLENDFFRLSQKITGRMTLDPVISGRLLHALQSIFLDYDTKIRDLISYIDKHDTPGDILRIAQEHGQADTVHNLIAAWYMGTVTQRMNAPMVAYYDALMYRPTQDALPVPTYCFAEPGWWTQDPPPLGVSVQSPKAVTPPAPPPVAVETKPAPAAPLKPHRPLYHKGH